MSTKTAIKKAIKLLEQEKILQSKKINKQKTIKILTELGKEILCLFENIENINKTFSTLQNTVNDYNDLTNDSEKIFRSKLLSRGWIKKDVESFYDIVNLLDIFIQLYISHICNLLLYRFISITHNYKVNNTAKIILMKIIMDEIVKQFEIITKIKSTNIVQGDPESPDSDLQATRRFKSSYTYHNLLVSFSNQLDRIYTFNNLPISTDIQSKLNDLVKEMISLTMPTTKYLRFRRDRIQSRTFDQLKDEYSKPRNVHTENFSILAKIYNELIDIGKS
ncbi:MAG TPA: hypothetical protein VJ697_10295 [Nitrososphaeraceae archaeon]|nr:hypothetical protein [Nitrososphaeraceae archaeon]